MNWTQKHVGTQLVWGLTLSQEPLGGSLVQDHFAEIWRFFCKEIIASNQNQSWDHIRVDFWSEGGKMVIYPLDSQIRKGTPAAVIELTSPWFRDYVQERLFSPQPTERDDTEIEAVEKRLSEMMAAAAKQANICAMLGKYEIRILFCMPSSEDSFDEAIIKQA